MQDVLERGWNERTVTVNRNNLLEKLKANRDQHQKAYRESVAGYRQAALKKLKEKVARAQASILDNEAMIAAKIERFDPENPLGDRVIVISQTDFSLEVPRDHTKSYDVAIQMAEWEVGENIELTQSQFQCFVMDDWDWKEKFQHLNVSYTQRR